MSSFSAKMTFKFQKAGDVNTKDATDKNGNPIPFTIDAFDYLISGPVDIATGLRSGTYNIHAFEIDLAIDSGCVLLLDALTSNDTITESTITFSSLDGDTASPYMTIKIEQASIYYYEQIFNALNKNPLMIKIKISAQKYTFNGLKGSTTANFENKFAV